MPEIKAVLFDMYGTLVNIKTNEYENNIFENIARFLEYRRVFLSGNVLKELYFDQVNQQIAGSREKYPEIDVAKAFGYVLRDYGGTTDRYLAILVSQLYRALTREYLRLFEDTFWTLNEFRKHYRLGIISDAQRLFCKPELRAMRIENFFEAIVISSDYGFRKPDPRLFHIALDLLDVEASEAVYIGNNYNTDIIGARNARLAAAFLIRTTEHDKKDSGLEPAPDGILPGLREVFNKVNELNKAEITNKDDK